MAHVWFVDKKNITNRKGEKVLELELELHHKKGISLDEWRNFILKSDGSNISFILVAFCHLANWATPLDGVEAKRVRKAIEVYGKEHITNNAYSAAFLAITNEIKKRGSY